MFKRHIEPKQIERHFVIDTFGGIDDWTEITLEYARECNLIMQTIRIVNDQMWHMYRLPGDSLNTIPLE